MFFQVIKILLDRGALLPMPHDIRCLRHFQCCPPNESKLLVLVYLYTCTCIQHLQRCGCEDCSESRGEDSLRHSRQDGHNHNDHHHIYHNYYFIITVISNILKFRHAYNSTKATSHGQPNMKANA